jgi:hypothetical protein
MQIVYSFHSHFFSKMLKAISIIRRNGLHLHPFHSTLLLLYVLYCLLFPAPPTYSQLWSNKCRSSSQNGSIKAKNTRPTQPYAGPSGRGLRRRSAAARLLRMRVRIPPGAWMFACCECCVLSGRSLCDGLFIRPEESY